MLVSLIASYALIGAPLAIRVEDHADVSLQAALDIAAELGRSLERTAREETALDDPTWTACAPLDVCLAEVRARNGAEQVVLLKVYGGVTRVRVEARRFAGGVEPIASGEIDLPLDRSRWPSAIEGLGASLAVAASRSDPKATVSTTPPPAAAPESRGSAAPWIAMAAGVVSVAVAIGFGASSASARRAVETEPHSDEEIDALTGRVKGHGLTANILFGVAALSGVIGGVLLIGDL